MKTDELALAERPTAEEADALWRLVSRPKTIAPPLLSFDPGRVTASGATGPRIAGGPARAYTQVSDLRSTGGKGLRGVGSNGNVVIGAVLTMLGDFTLDLRESRFPPNRDEPTVQEYRGRAYRLAFVVSLAHGPAVPEGVIASKARAVEIVRPVFRCEYIPPNDPEDSVEILGSLRGLVQRPLHTLPADFDRRRKVDWSSIVTGAFGSSEPLRFTEPGEFPLTGLTMAFDFDYLGRVDDLG